MVVLINDGMEKQKMRKHKVVIMGGGPAGLTAAYSLVQKGYEVILLEQEMQVGGQSKTIHYNGYQFDLGGHRFLSAYDDVLSLVKNLLGEELGTVPRKSSILFDGQLIRYPLKLEDVLRKMKLSVSARAVIDYCWEKLKNMIKEGPEESFEGWTRKRFGKTLYDIYFGMYTEKVWGVSPKTISADWARKRITSVNLMEVMKSLIGLKKQQGVFECSEFYYPSQGIGRIYEKLAESVIAMGGTIHLGSKVSEITLGQGGKIASVGYERSGDHCETSGDWVVSTIPLPEFISAIRPAPSEKIQQIARSLPNRCLRFVALLVDRSQITDNLWIHVPEKHIRFFRIQEFRNWSQKMAPEGKTLLLCEFACNKEDSLWNMEEERLKEICIQDLEKLGMINRAEVLEYRVEALEYGYPLYSLDYKEKLEILYDYLLSIPNIVAHGRQGLYRYDTMDHAMKTGMIASAIVAGDLPRKELIRTSEVTDQY